MLISGESEGAFEYVLEYETGDGEDAVSPRGVQQVASVAVALKKEVAAWNVVITSPSDRGEGSVDSARRQIRRAPISNSVNH